MEQSFFVFRSGTFQGTRHDLRAGVPETHEVVGQAGPQRGKAGRGSGFGQALDGGDTGGYGIGSVLAGHICRDQKQIHEQDEHERSCEEGCALRVDAGEMRGERTRPEKGPL